MKHIALFLCISLGILSCNKYENGPAFSLLTKKTRLVRSWVIEETLLNDEPVQLNSNFTQSVYTFEKDGEYSVTGVNNQVQTDQIGTWEFVNDKESVAITINGVTKTYRISRLKDKSLWLIDEFPGGDFMYKYIPAMD